MRMFTYAYYKKRSERGTYGGMISRDRAASLIAERGQKLVTRKPLVSPQRYSVKTVQLDPEPGCEAEYVRIRYE